MFCMALLTDWLIGKIGCNLGNITTWKPFSSSQYERDYVITVKNLRWRKHDWDYTSFTLSIIDTQKEFAPINWERNISNSKFFHTESLTPPVPSSQPPSSQQTNKNRKKQASTYDMTADFLGGASEFSHFLFTNSHSLSHDRLIVPSPGKRSTYGRLKRLFTTNRLRRNVLSRLVGWLSHQRDNSMMS